MSTTGRLEALKREGLRFAGMSLAVSATMAFFKVAIALRTGSHALLANALYSMNDVLSSIAVAVSLKLGTRAPNEEFPFGYGKAEHVAIGMVSLSVAIGVCLMFFYSVLDIITGVGAPPHFLAMGIAALSFAVSWTLSKRGHRIAVGLRSPILATSAEHYHADAHGSLATIVGVAAAVAGFHVVDRVIAIGETLHLVALSGTLLAKAVKGLMDQAVGPEDIELTERTCLEVSGVEDVSYVRSRRLGSLAWIDLGVAVSPTLSVREALDIGDRVRGAVEEVLGEGIVAQVRTHGRSHVGRRVSSGGSGHG